MVPQEMLAGRCGVHLQSRSLGRLRQVDVLKLKVGDILNNLVLFSSNNKTKQKPEIKLKGVY